MSSPTPQTSVNVLTAERMLAIEASSVVSGTVNGAGHLILTKHDATTIDAGLVKGTNGTNGATGAQGATGPTGPTGPSGAVTGEIKAFAFATVPTGYLQCGGQAVSRTTFAALFAAIGTTWGAGDGTSTFNVPNLVNKFMRGVPVGTNAGVDTHTHTNGAHHHPLSSAGQALINVLGSPNSVQLLRAASASFSANASQVTSGSATNQTAQTTGTALSGQTDDATAPDTGSASNVPAHIGANFCIKT